MCEKKKGKGKATTKVKNDCYDKIENGWDVSKQNQGKPGPGVAVALVVGVPGTPPRATPGVLLHDSLDWLGFFLGVSSGNLLDSLAGGEGSGFT